ncbi:MAG: hypothetical protein PVF76_16815, partial [Syntrophobacterales bacterium]
MVDQRFHKKREGGTNVLVNRSLAILVALLTSTFLLTGISSAAVSKLWPGPEGGTVQALVVDPDVNTTVYAGTKAGGVFKRTSAGTDWVASNNGLTNLNIQALVVDPNRNTDIYAGTNGGGVFKSRDSGKTWTAINNGLGGALNVQALAITPKGKPFTLYAGTSAGGVFINQDGTNWNSPTVSGFSNVQAVAIDFQLPSTVYV